MRILQTYASAREARHAIEQLLHANADPPDRVLRLALARLRLIEQQADRALNAIAERRASA